VATFAGQPEQIVVDFLGSSGTPVRLLDLGAEFLSSMNIVDKRQAERPFRVAVERKQSKAGNAYYEYSQNAVPLPDGLSTMIKIEGVVIPMGRIHPSNNGYPTRDGVTQIMVGNVPYKVTAYLTEGKTPFYVKVIAHKMPATADTNLAKARSAPRGGQLLL
jgi:hypothetical protein